MPSMLNYILNHNFHYEYGTPRLLKVEKHSPINAVESSTISPTKLCQTVIKPSNLPDIVCYIHFPLRQYLASKLAFQNFPRFAVLSYICYGLNENMK